MKRPSREEYERAVALARAAIREAQDAPRIRADRTPQAVLAKFEAEQARGEILTEAEAMAKANALAAALAAALAEQESRKLRGRGRPKGKRAEGHRELRAAIWAVQGTGLNPYRNHWGGRPSQCDAIAEAMKAEGFRTLCNYDAAVREMKAYRKSRNDRSSGILGITRQIQALLRALNFAAIPILRQIQEAEPQIKATIAAAEPLLQLTREGTLAFAALAVHIREQAVRAIESHTETKR